MTGCLRDQTQKQSSFGMRPHHLSLIEGNPGVRVTLSLTSTWDLTALFHRKLRQGGKEAILQREARVTPAGEFCGLCRGNIVSLVYRLGWVKMGLRTGPVSVRHTSLWGQPPMFPVSSSYQLTV